MEERPRQTTAAIVNFIENVIVVDDMGEEPKSRRKKAAGANKGHLRAWWQPVLDKIKLDDFEQEPPFWVVTNNVVLNTPFPGIQIKALATVKRSQIGVFLSGTSAANVMMI